VENRIIVVLVRRGKNVQAGSVYAIPIVKGRSAEMTDVETAAGIAEVAIGV